MNELLVSTFWRAGGAALEITPDGEPYLCGYPHVDRLATGVNDPLLASAICVESPRGGVYIGVACDVLQLPRGLTQRAREKIVERVAALGDTAIGVESVMITATHTHSGPLMLRMVTHHGDPHVPEVDAAYLASVEERVVEAGVMAYTRRRPATLGWAIADGSGLGTHRRDPAAPSIPRLPVVSARDAESGELIAVMAVCSMHPTVLHEDSTLISGDFPGLARQWLSNHVLPAGCPFVYHMGASGNQSPRHVVRANTLDEAQRLGELLGREVRAAIEASMPMGVGDVRCGGRRIDLPLREFLPVDEAQRRVHAAECCWKSLKQSGASRAEIRTAEVDCFGCNKALALSEAAAAGLVEAAVRERMPAEVQVVRLGEHVLVAWPGEVFVEFALEVMRAVPSATVVTLANGELHGYLVTQDAIDAGSYEAAHGIFASPDAGHRLVHATLEVIRELEAAGDR